MSGPTNRLEFTHYNADGEPVFAGTWSLDLTDEQIEAAGGVEAVERFLPTLARPSMPLGASTEDRA